MSYETLEYIRKHPNLYRLLREDSSYYEAIFRDNSSVYSLERVARERFHTRFIDRIESIGDKINLLSTFFDVLKS